MFDSQKLSFENFVMGYKHRSLYVQLRLMPSLSGL